MRILLVNRFDGGSQIPTGRMLADVARVLAGQGHEVVVLASAGVYDGASQARDQRTKRPKDEGTAHLRVETVAVPGWMPRAGAWVWFTAQAWWRIPRMRWDACVLMTDPPLLPLLAGRLRRRNPQGRIVVWLMDLYPEALAASSRLSATGAVYRSMFARRQAALARADLLVCLGEAQQSRLGQIASRGTAIEVVPPWDERPGLEASSPTSQQHIALYAGNLGEAHSFVEVLDAAAHLPADWTLRFAVRGAKATALSKQARGDEWRVTSDKSSRPAKGGARVEITGYASEEETPQLLASARVHLITMAPGWEGIVVPSKLYGCLRTGRPVLFIGPADSDTAREVLRHDWGAVLPPGAAGGQVAESILRLAARPNHSPSRNEGAVRVAEAITQAVN